MSNRLANESSPYLLQHKDNPVDWYPWGAEALTRAKAEHRPILLSVGYSACHWCHVMEHESFEDPETARLMNEHFVNIKVDREERPDVDALYMQAVQQMTGHGGWPMTVFLTPEAAPFYGGTYFPPQPRHGLPSFRQLLSAVHLAFTSRFDQVNRSAEELRSALAQGMSVNPDPMPVNEAMLQRAFHGLGSRFDHALGGFGGAPKFPQPMIVDFLLRYWARSGSVDAKEMAEKTLDSMARGGIYDHIGGGFHRYSVDARWLVPHFEKMLYDNAQLARLYTRAFQATGRSDFRRVAEETLAYVVREMRDASGGFYSSQDADSEGVEGKFYAWASDEIEEAIPRDQLEDFSRYFDVSDAGNWEGVNILNTPTPRDIYGEREGASEVELEGLIAEWRDVLYRRRAERVWPGRDEKVLTSWNAMMLQAFAEAGRVLDVPAYTDVAVANAEFLLRELERDGRLLRTWRDGEAKIDAFLEDYALLVDALVELYSATFDSRWIRDATAIADRLIEGFWSPEEEMFYDTRLGGEELIIRPRDIYDNATPSGTSAAVHALLRLARLTGNEKFERVASRVLRGMADVATRMPQAFGHLLGALSLHLSTPVEIAIVGDPSASGTRELLAVMRHYFLPEAVSALQSTEPGATTAADLIPVLAERIAIDGQSTAYVCEGYSCRLPVTTPSELEQELRAIAPPHLSRSR